MNLILGLEPQGRHFLSPVRHHSLPSFASWPAPPAHQGCLWRSSSCRDRVLLAWLLELPLSFASCVATDPRIIGKCPSASLQKSTQTVLWVAKRYIRLCLLHSTAWRVSRTTSHRKLWHDSANDPTVKVNFAVNIHCGGVEHWQVEGGRYLETFSHECSSSLWIDQKQMGRLLHQDRSHGHRLEH